MARFDRLLCRLPNGTAYSGFPVRIRASEAAHPDEIGVRSTNTPSGVAGSRRLLRRPPLSTPSSSLAVLIPFREEFRLRS